MRKALFVELVGKHEDNSDIGTLVLSSLPADQAARKAELYAAMQSAYKGVEREFPLSDDLSLEGAITESRRMASEKLIGPLNQEFQGIRGPVKAYQVPSNGHYVGQVLKEVPKGAIPIN